MKIAVFSFVCAALGIVLGVAMARAKLGDAAALVVPGSDSAEGGEQSRVRVPRVSVDQETFDFGYMERHSSRSHEFQFKNDGDAPLELTVGETTCKCTVGEVGDKLVQPGATVPVKLSWTAQTDEPEFRQTAHIHTNDPARRDVRLSVVGRVSDASSFFPKSFLFGNVPLGTTKLAEVKVVSFRDEPFEITGTEWMAPASEENFEVEVDALSRDEYPAANVHWGYRVRITTRPSLPFGPIGGWLRIKTNMDSVPQLEVPFAGKVVSDFSIYGKGYNDKRDLLDLGQVNGSEGAERDLFLLLHGERGKELELSIRETYPEYLKAELGERSEPSDKLVRVPLKIRVDAGAPPAVHLGGRDGDPGRVVIQTNQPGVPEITVHVQFTVQ